MTAVRKVAFGSRVVLVWCCALVAVLVLGASQASAAKSRLQVFESAPFSQPEVFQEPSGVAVDQETGNVYVTDSTGKAIDVFGAEGGTPAGGIPSQIPNVEFFAEEPQELAVDNSCFQHQPMLTEATTPTCKQFDPSYGDIYAAETNPRVIAKYKLNILTDEYELAQTLQTPGEPNGVAVDTEGNVYAAAYQSKALTVFNPAGVIVGSIAQHGSANPAYVAVGAPGTVYVGDYEGSDEKLEVNAKYEILHEASLDVSGRALAIGAGENVLVDHESYVAEYDTAGALVNEFGTGILKRSRGLAVNPQTNDVYVSGRSSKNITAFGVPIQLPEVEPPALVEGGVTLHGTVDPEGATIAECHFEYGLGEAEPGQYEHSVSCSPAEPSGNQPVPVTAEVAGLALQTTYHYQLTIVLAGHARSSGTASFYTSTKPEIAGGAVANVGSTEAEVRTSINAAGLPTSYRLEYGTGEGYGASTAEMSIGAPTQPVAVSVHLSGLQSGTEYHSRFVAVNGIGSTQGPDATFTTSTSTAASASVLPDNRSYELVSSPTENTTVDAPGGTDHGLLGVNGSVSIQPFRAASTGNAIVYPGSSPIKGGNGAEGGGQANEFLATRGATGWFTGSLTPPGTDSFTEYTFFTDDLSAGMFFADGGTEILASPASPGCADDVYSRGSDGSYHSLIPRKGTEDGCGFPRSYDASKDGSHLLFHDEEALTPGAAHGRIGDGYTISAGYNLYDAVVGHLYQVNVLPDGQAEQQPTAWLGSPPEGSIGSADFSNAVSADGSRIFWTSNEFVGAKESEYEYRAKALYLRENDTQPQSPLGPNRECTIASDACTVQIDTAESGCVSEGKCKSGEGLFWTASSDGSRVFFSDCQRLTANSTAAGGENGRCVRKGAAYNERVATGEDLYEYNVDTRQLADLTVDANASESLGANVQGMLGASDDGSYLYFVATGVLANAVGAMKDLPAPGELNLYLVHEGSIIFITTLAGGDNQYSTLVESAGDWRLSPGNRTAEATPDGHQVIFESHVSLTGYDNEHERNAESEVFVYNATTGSISCASCNPTGRPPERDTGNMLPVPGSGGKQMEEYTQRWMSNDGSRVFFDSKLALLPQDTNGRYDVYEWERPASGSESDNSCTRSASSFSQINDGCLYLLSGGTGSDDSLFADADDNGANAFFTARGGLTADSQNENVAMYDARVNGGFPVLTTSCTGTGCQGVPPAPPVFATPSSVTFTGVGNFAAPKPAVQPKRKSVKCGKGSSRKRGKCVKRKIKPKAKKGNHSSKRSKMGRK
jgi:SMP-30/Gluconolactonase/LRE-like region/NHL repeat